MSLLADPALFHSTLSSPCVWQDWPVLRGSLKRTELSSQIILPCSLAGQSQGSPRPTAHKTGIWFLGMNSQWGVTCGCPWGWDCTPILGSPQRSLGNPERLWLANCAIKATGTCLSFITENEAPPPTHTHTTTRASYPFPGLHIWLKIFHFVKKNWPYKFV